jgi:ribosomal protein L11 methyltransferase
VADEQEARRADDPTTADDGTSADETASADDGTSADDGISAAGTWIELCVTADQEAVEAVSEILSRAAPGGVSVETPFRTEQEGLATSPMPDARATIRAYVSALDPAAAERAIAEVRERLGHLTAFDLRPIGELEIRAVNEEDWATAWKEHFPVMRIGRRIVIRPTWREFEPTPDDIVIALDPGMAFGTGLHPTTRLCLAGLEAWDEAGLVRDASTLDVGCGSGILAIGAALLGAAPVVAIDTDSVAVESSRENARRNDVDLRASQGSLPVDPGPFDLVFANLVASLLVELAGELAATVRPGDGIPGSSGRLLASGIFIDREPEVRAAFAAAGLRVVSRRVETDWVALDLERPDA